MGRFLIFFSYFGNRFSGIQKQKHLPNLPTIQGVLENALKDLYPANEIQVYHSSRTDKGVHALRNTVHVDLEFPAKGQDYRPDVITNVMNKYLKECKHDVRVLETKRVNKTFHARFSAQGRKYVYRLAHRVKNHTDLKFDHSEGPLVPRNPDGLRRTYRNKPWKIPTGDFITTLDSDKLLVFSERLDIDKLMRAAELLSGIHNFTSFTRPENIKKPQTQPHPCKLVTIGVKRGQPLAYRLQKGFQPHIEDFEFWDIHVHSRSFLYRMVRRLVGAMVLHAQNKIFLDNIRDILDKPRHDFRFSSHMSVPEDGLFLQDVEYDSKDLIFDEQLERFLEKQMKQKQSRVSALHASSYSHLSQILCLRHNQLYKDTLRNNTSEIYMAAKDRR